MKFKIIIFLFCLCSASLTAQVFPKLGAERAGISALDFLKLDVSPRAIALGGAQISSVGDGYAIGWNPAAMTDLQYSTVALSTRLMPSGISNSFASGIIKFKNKSDLGISAEALNSGAIEKTTVFQPDGTGQYVYASNLALGLSYAKMLSNYFSLGASVKYVREQLAEFHANTVSVDVGFLYRTDFKDMRFAAMLQNFGPNSALGGDMPSNVFVANTNNKIDNYTGSSVFKLAVPMVPYKTDYQRLTTEVQLNHPSDNAENICLGLEYMYYKVLFLRAGYTVGLKDQHFPTFGLGIKSHVGKCPLTLDYGAQVNTYLGIINTVGATLSINNVKDVQK